MRQIHRLALALMALLVLAAPATATGAHSAAAATPRPTATRPAATRPAATRPAATATRPAPRGTPTPTTTPLPATAAAGLLVYQRLGCIGCHKLEAAGSKGGFGPAHDHIATVAAQRILAADYAGAATTASEYIAESIVDPEVYIVADYRLLRYKMPQYPKIKPDEVAALVAFMMEQE